MMPGRPVSQDESLQHEYRRQKIRLPNLRLYGALFSFLLTALLLVAGCNNSEHDASEKINAISVCPLVSDDQIAGISKKTMIKAGEGRQCYWSREAGGMAYFDINVHDAYQDLRSYFAKELSSHVTLEQINNLGDEGLMTVVEGTLGVIVIRKGTHILQSAVTFLDIEPGSKQHQALWDIYQTVLAEL